MVNTRHGQCAHKDLTESSVKREFVNEGLQDVGLVFYSETDSTNTRAKIFASSDAWQTSKAPTVFAAKMQTGGRGRLGRSFLSDGRGVYMSYLFRPTDAPGNAIQLTSRAAVIAARAIEEESGGEVLIKWVNDLYMKGKKIAGILTEGRAASDGTLEYMLIGIGINLFGCDFPAELADIATDVERATGKRLSPERLIARIARGLRDTLHDPSLIEEYRRRSFLIGERVNVIKHAECYPATVLGIADDFSLAVKREDGSSELIMSGEVTVRKLEKGET